MKKLIALCALCLFFWSTVIWTGFHYQNQRIRSGELILLNPTEGVFAHCRVFVDKKDRTIAASPFASITLWEDGKGTVFHRTLLVSRYGSIVGNLPASTSEISFYRNYFPRS